MFISIGSDLCLKKITSRHSKTFFFPLAKLTQDQNKFVSVLAMPWPRAKKTKYKNESTVK